MLSVVITAFNEEKNLPRVIKSVKGLADEVVVVDTESTDNTASVAKKMGCKVYRHPKPGIVEIARNFSISKAAGDWILLLDADEEVPEKLVREIKKIMQENSVDYCRIPRKNLIFSKWIISSHWWPDYVYRLFKKGAVIWQETIHSIPITNGVGIDLSPTEDHAIIHHHYSSVGEYIDKINRYTDFQCQQLSSSQYQFKWSDIIKKPLNEFLMQYFARRGYKDGLHGLALSLLQAFSELVLYLKLWQESGFAQHKITPKDTVEALSSKKKEFIWWFYESRIETAFVLFRPWLKLIRKLKTI